LQVPIEQVPAAHDAAALAKLQTTPQPPQSESVVVLVSQPSMGSALQSSQPALQAIEQEPRVHDGAPLVLEQTLPQAPQLLTLVSVETSQPLDGMVSQSSYPTLHPERAQVPVEQSEVALDRLHGVPQLPQSERVVSEVSQPSAAVALQSSNPAVQDAMSQVLAAQVADALAREQAFPHAPQLATSSPSDVSQPFEALASQSPNPAVQLMEQTLLVQDGVPLVPSHATPQELQFAASLVVSTSQPSAASALQSASPALQELTRHAPVLQSPVPPAMVQTVPQLPQSESVFSGVSQPWVGSASQSPNPAEQVGEQMPVVQAVVPLVLVQVTPQAPQSLVVVRSVSQPSDGVALQSSQPATQLIEQAPRVQDAEPFALEHTLPQAPQLLVSVSMETSQPFVESPSQLPNPALQDESAHVPVEQSELALARLHTVPHPPQSESVVSDVSHPFAATPSQSPNPAEQVAISQTPAVHVADALASEQAFPHAPQLAASASRDVSHPFAGLPSQSSKPAVQVMEHAPPTQEGVPLVLSHASPHPLQFAASLVMSTSQPSEASPLQSARPALQEPTAQAPVLQSPVPPAMVQTAPQVPQSESVFKGVSQPWLGLPSQSPKPAEHVGVHAPETHVVEPFVFVQV
jgi:hypothetical protein